MARWNVKSTKSPSEESFLHFYWVKLSFFYWTLLSSADTQVCVMHIDKQASIS